MNSLRMARGTTIERVIAMVENGRQRDAETPEAGDDSYHMMKFNSVSGPLHVSSMPCIEDKHF